MPWLSFVNTPVCNLSKESRNNNKKSVGTFPIVIGPKKKESRNCLVSFYISSSTILLLSG